MTIRNEPGAYGFLAGLLVLLFGLFVNASCMSSTQVRKAIIAQEWDASVGITMMCLQPDGTLDIWTGSGTIVEGNRVLTAAHVVQHSGICSLQTATNQGAIRDMIVAKLDAKDDLAALAPAPNEVPLPETHIRFGQPPQLWDEVCAFAMLPTTMHKCGEVEPQWQSSEPFIQFNAVMEPGNSGAGLYNENGELVGVVNKLHYNANNGQWMTGMAVPLAEHLKDVL